MLRQLKPGLRITICVCSCRTRRLVHFLTRGGARRASVARGLTAMADKKDKPQKTGGKPGKK